MSSAVGELEPVVAVAVAVRLGEERAANSDAGVLAAADACGGVAAPEAEEAGEEAEAECADGEGWADSSAWLRSSTARSAMN